MRITTLIRYPFHCARQASSLTMRLGLCMGLASLASLAHAATSSCVDGHWVANPNDTDMPSVRYETAHFAFRWSGNAVTAATAAAAGEQLEKTWSTFIERIGFPTPYCQSATKYKVSVHIDPSFGLSGGVTSSGGMGMWIAAPALADHWGLAHEFTHALQGSTGGMRNSPYSGWIWESHANWMAHQMDEFHGSEVHCSEMLVNYPHLYLGSTRDRYCNWQFMEYLKDRYGYGIINDLWAKAPKDGDTRTATADPFSVIRDNMGWSQSQLNDVFGEWARHNVNWDYLNPDGSDQGALYRQKYGSNHAFDPSATDDDGNLDRALRLTSLDTIANSSGGYQVPFAWAPQRWGYNLVRLIPATGAKSIDVDFQGLVQTTPAVSKLAGLTNEPTSIAAPDSDWRWGLVAISQSGKARYSVLRHGSRASLHFGLKSDEKEVYLVVMGTPSTPHKIQWDQPYYSVYRYPWRITLKNAYPEGHQPNASQPTSKGHRHTNGGGWVAEGARVDSTAYVGPNARVLSGNVLGHARVEDHATVAGGTVQDNGVIGALTVLRSGSTVKGNAKAYTVFKGIGAFASVTLSGTAQFRGDMEAQAGASPSKGVFYGYADATTITDAHSGANLTQPVPEVTQQP